MTQISWIIYGLRTIYVCDSKFRSTLFHFSFCYPRQLCAISHIPGQKLKTCINWSFYLHWTLIVTTKMQFNYVKNQQKMSKQSHAQISILERQGIGRLYWLILSEVKYLMTVSTEYLFSLRFMRCKNGLNRIINSENEKKVL